MDTRRRQIGPRLVQLQASLDPRLLPCPVDPQIGVKFPAALPDEAREEGGENPVLHDLPGQRHQQGSLLVEGGRKARRDRQLEIPPGLSPLRQRQGNRAAKRLPVPVPQDGSGAQVQINLPFLSQPADLPSGKGCVAVQDELLRLKKRSRRPPCEKPFHIDRSG